MIPLYRLKAVMDFLAKFRGWASANEVADGVGMAWNTAKSDLEFLVRKGYILKRGNQRAIYKLNRTEGNNVIGG
jgi:predicted ArsR family transcriptional regulator